ncbi:putative nuclease HARBI1 [Amyelois transitella]|uniref:putative nuclease HARBI1 n=1 Tax=Amyelois transitella TaxID=680683 RepID=UPI00298F5E4D|nr:putative nuclease HARBI1 [Amyelois transitella]XP_060809566.1 putative nuclease HARBI1 [Amyelois transitella]
MARLAAQLNLLDEAERVDARQRRRRTQIARYCAAAIEIGDEEFVANYRITKEIFLELVEVLSPYLKAPSRRSDIPIKFKILVALSFYATGSYQRIVGRNYGTAMSQQSVSRCIKEVTNAFNQIIILQKYIKFPTNVNERNAIKMKFYEKYGIPGVIGCVDGTHVAMVRPSENEDWYFNRKHYHSRNVQILCDFDLNIISVDACFGGATHDSHIFNQHAIKNHLIDLVNQGETVYLLGDSGYAQREYMMTPIVNAAAGSPEEFYTQIHCSARNRVERTIGLLKARWRCLLKHRVLHYKPDMVSKIINACCVLHNMCNTARIPSPSEVNPSLSSGTAQQPSSEPAPSAAAHSAGATLELRRGVEARQRIVNMLWTRRRTN